MGHGVVKPVTSDRAVLIGPSGPWDRWNARRDAPGALPCYAYERASPHAVPGPTHVEHEAVRVGNAATPTPLRSPVAPATSGVIDAIHPRKQVT